MAMGEVTREITLLCGRVALVAMVARQERYKPRRTHKKMYKLIFPGRPVPAARMTQRDKYTKRQVQRYLAYKAEIGWRARAAGIKLIEGTVLVEITVYICKRCGDWDNYAKAICDGLNGIAWLDDKQIKHGRVDIYEVATTTDQRAEVRIQEVGVMPNATAAN